MTYRRFVPVWVSFLLCAGMGVFPAVDFPHCAYSCRDAVGIRLQEVAIPGREMGGEGCSR